MNVNSPIYAWSAPYLTGFGLTYVSATSLVLGAGAATNSTVENVIISEAPVTLSLTKNGYNGLDTGTVAANTFYKVYAIGSSANPVIPANQQVSVENQYPAGGLLSTSAVPSLPLGYDMYRQVGTVLTDGSGNLLKFTQTGAGLDRTMWYDVGIVVLTGGSSSSFTGIDLSAAVPVIGTIVYLQAAFIPSGNGSSMQFMTYSSTATSGTVIMSGSSASVNKLQNVFIASSEYTAKPFIKYKVSGTSASALVTGYVDKL